MSDIKVTIHHTMTRFLALSPEAKEWMVEHFADSDVSVIVNTEHKDDLIDIMKSQGFVLED